MIVSLFIKEMRDFFKSKTFLLFMILYSFITAYGFYSAVILYSQASEAAIGNPLYATGFEPTSGVFVPVFGGLFFMLSFFAPFLFIQSVGKEKKYRTMALVAQYPVSLFKVYLTKLFSAKIIFLIIFIVLLPLFLLWNFLGGHINIEEILLLSVGYFLYGMFVVAISFFTSSLFDNTSQASIASLGIIMFSWFIDFARDMNIFSFAQKLSDWSLTVQLKNFEYGILSLKSVLFFILLIYFFAVMGFWFFNFRIKRKSMYVFTTILVFAIMFFISSKVNINYDLSESKKNSFSISKNKFLKEIGKLQIDIYLNPTDSRAKDFMNDFLKKLKLIKNDVKINFVSGNELKKNYGMFRYSLNGKAQTTYSNSEEEIFMILQELSDKTVKAESSNTFYKGYPLMVKSSVWKKILFGLYLFLLPLFFLLIFIKNNSEKHFNTLI